MFLVTLIIRRLFLNLHYIPYTQQTLSMGPINISLRTLTISCDYLRCRFITIRLDWINSDIKQNCPLRFISIGQKLATLRFTVNYGNLKWFTENRKWSRYVYTIYLIQICIGPAKKCLLGILSAWKKNCRYCSSFFIIIVDILASFLCFKNCRQCSSFIQYNFHQKR